MYTDSLDRMSEELHSHVAAHIFPGRGSHKVQQQKSWMWGPTGEQEWSPDLTTGTVVYHSPHTIAHINCSIGSLQVSSVISHITVTRKTRYCILHVLFHLN